MADPPLDTDAKDDTSGDTRTPRWVKVSGIIALALVVIMLSVMFLGGHDPSRGGHGPGMDMSAGAIGGDTAVSSVAFSATDDHTPPVGDR